MNEEILSKDTDITYHLPNTMSLTCYAICDQNLPSSLKYRFLVGKIKFYYITDTFTCLSLLVFHSSFDILARPSWMQFIMAKKALPSRQDLPKSLTEIPKLAVIWLRHHIKRASLAPTFEQHSTLI